MKGPWLHAMGSERCKRVASLSFVLEIKFEMGRMRLMDDKCTSYTHCPGRF